LGLLLDRFDPAYGISATRAVAAALAFATSYLLLDRFDPDLSISVTRAGGSGDSPSAAPGEDGKIRVFYNLFLKGPEDEERVRRIVEEQFAHVDAALHFANVSVTSIGRRPASLPDNSFVREHRDEGGEDLTLRALWEHCRADAHPDAKVVYLHSKGSYHPTEANDRLRNFVTRGALSAECAALPPDCDVCSSRMSPLPHPHTSGNMWLARCDYVAQLMDPLASEEGRLPEEAGEDDPCRGRGRYLGEHCIHSHPSVRPCDLYPGREFTWAHLRVPRVGDGAAWKELARAPRFGFDTYVLPGMCASERPETLSMTEFVRLRKENYGMQLAAGDDGCGWRHSAAGSGG